MDERVLERMVARSGRTVQSSGAIALCASGVFLTAIFWIVLRVVLGGIGGVFHLPMVFLTASFALLPAVAVIPPIASWSLSARSGHESLPLHEAVHQRWKQSVALFLYALCVAVVELLLGVAVAVWCGIEAIPVFGGAVYLFFSWVPSIITLVMGIILFLHILVLFSVGTILAVTAVEQKGLFSEILVLLRREWVLRVKLLFIGSIPSVILYGATTIWTMKGLPTGIEFSASIFRAAAYSIFEAPLLLFWIHIAVEADRYIQWVSIRRV